ncbi:hypothetical protein MHY87_15165 [Microvirga sp. ACRRW]|uniref:hypothetical protein n=1 Tax=Microvirga sp. ACRRW TaxID=2918205 RepID=UPI001EF4B27C|nr:hypothetical protein [Microvirga sp. ACRRW]MCG7394245.1 hypothetical protein [Microvirga sp. ACRRW]
MRKLSAAALAIQLTARTNVILKTSFLLVPFSLGGCATVVPSFDVPTDPSTESPTVKSIVDRVTCELANLVTPGAPNETDLLTGQYEVAVQLDLTVNDTGGLSPSLAYISTGAPFIFNANAKFEKSREQYFSQKLYYSLLDLRQELDDREKAFRKGSATRLMTDCSKDIETNLAGDLGIRQVVDMALGVNYGRTTAKMSDKGAFGGSVNFTVTKNLSGVGPTWALTHFVGPGPLASASEVNIDKLTYAFAIAEKPLNSKQLAARKLQGQFASGRSATNAAAEQFVQQLQVNQISTQLMTIRALQ